MPKKFGVNSKWNFQLNVRATVAKDIKEKEKKATNEKIQKKKEDELWKDEGDKILKSKEERKEEKKQQELTRKQENKLLYEEEMANIKSKIKPTESKKITQAEIERNRQKALMATLMKNVSKDLPENDDDMENEIEENINHLLREQEAEDKLRYDEIINANSIEDALNKLDVNESMKHPEKKVKAAFHQYVENQLPEIKKEYPSLKRSQHLQIINENWKKSSENPFNKPHLQYNEKAK